ncbi:DUF2490 domain-containing protein [Salegentibacter sp. F188]|uniref:DUF2490 domain-containing protein n=1 Tax=Autumnicola patrickiae TaxID=3075591 RepID=A0ABU3E2C6_9FLAO|nr:DUF2490 domain-containing protein [Salegentibacter sp. F188]MDT0690106.1 DUF2490 domain-containing protein [Salegentibacter sp. F188]
MKKLILLIVLGFFCLSAQAQEITDDYGESKEFTSTTGLWLGLYTKYRLNEKFFYYGEYHLRRTNNFVDDMAQVYLRFGLTYLLNTKVELTAGIVTPFYWAPEQDQAGQDNVVPQYRFWQQVVLVQPFDRLKLYHQFRFEQRWKRDYEIDAPFKLTHRFRYKLGAYYPLNNHKLVNKTLFASFYEEIFIQAGKTITYNYLEDNRAFLGLGYIINQNLQVQAGYMWTFRYKGGPNSFEHRHIPRISLYHNLDFHRKRIERRKERIDILMDEF